MFITIHLNIVAIIVITIVLVAEIAFKPRIDKTGDGKVILWYGKKNRYYKILWK